MIFVYAKSLDKKDDKVEIADSKIHKSKSNGISCGNKLLHRNFIKTMNCMLSIKDLVGQTGLSDYSINVLDKMLNDHPLGIGGSNIPINNINITDGGKNLTLNKLSVKEKVLNHQERKKVVSSTFSKINKKKKSVTLTNIATKRINRDISNDNTISYKIYSALMLQKLPFKVKVQISHLIRDISLISKVEILSKQNAQSTEIIFVRVTYKNQVKKSYYAFETQHGKFFFNKNGKTVERILKHKETLPKYIISSCFGVRWFKGRYGFHGGLDLSTSYGTDIYSLESGIVTKSERRHDYGNYVVVQHRSANCQKTMYTLYAHMSKRSVKVGDRIQKGQKLGEIGSTGWSTGPHLHLEFMNYVKSKKNPSIDINFGSYSLLNKDLPNFNKLVENINNIYKLKTNKTIVSKVLQVKKSNNTNKTTKKLSVKVPIKKVTEQKKDISISNKNVIRAALNKNRKNKNINSN